jgi:hypothetical protein
MEVSHVRRLNYLRFSQLGQTTAEYALVLLVAGLVVGVFAAFVKSGAMSDVFHSIVSQLVDRAQG